MPKYSKVERIQRGITKLTAEYQANLETLRGQLAVALLEAHEANELVPTPTATPASPEKRARSRRAYKRRNGKATLRKITRLAQTSRKLAYEYYQQGLSYQKAQQKLKSEHSLVVPRLALRRAWNRWTAEHEIAD